MITIQKTLDILSNLWYRCGATGQKENFMAKFIKKQYGRVVSVEPREPSEIRQEWNWRREFEGFCGVLHIYQSQRQYPGKHYIVIYDMANNYLKTGAGDLAEHENRITLTTKNSIYTFECVNIERKTGD